MEVPTCSRVPRIVAITLVDVSQSRSLGKDLERLNRNCIAASAEGTRIAVRDSDPTLPVVITPDLHDSGLPLVDRSVEGPLRAQLPDRRALNSLTGRSRRTPSTVRSITSL